MVVLYFFGLWLLLTALQSPIFLCSWKRLYFMYAIVSCLAAAYFSFSFCLFLSFAVSERFGWMWGAGRALHWFYVVLVADDRNTMLSRLSFLFIFFQKDHYAIPWISHISVLYIFIASFVRTIIPYTQHTYIKTLHILTSGNRKFSHNTHKYAHRERSLPSSLTRKGTRTHSRTANRTHHKYCMHLKMVKSSSLYFAHSQLWITVRGCKKSFWFLCFIMF